MSNDLFVSIPNGHLLLPLVISSALLCVILNGYINPHQTADPTPVKNSYNRLSPNNLPSADLQILKLPTLPFVSF